MGVTTAPIDWYAARAAGIVAYLLLTAVVLVGLTLAGRVQLPGWPKFAVTDVHRFGGLLVGVFLSVHVATVALDSYTRFSLTQLIVPLTSTYRPLWTALGIVGAELLVAIGIANALRRRIPYRYARCPARIQSACAVGYPGRGPPPRSWLTCRNVSRSISPRA
jgi:methionine sulfoxide reductase heme-binding subunit